MLKELNFGLVVSMHDMGSEKNASIYRMVTKQKMCVHGLKAKDLLRRKGYRIEDNHLSNADEISAFKKQNDVKTLPQIFIGGERIGGFDDLQVHFGYSIKTGNETTYRPIIAIFTTAAFLTLSFMMIDVNVFEIIRFFELFISISMVLLGLQKIQDLDRFATMFLNYDLLAQRWIRYGYIYPFIEIGAGFLMMTGSMILFAAPITFIAASIGAVSVFKAVYIDKRELKCACVGGDSKVPLGFVSLLENIMMMLMAMWMLFNF